MNNAKPKIASQRDAGRGVALSVGLLPDGRPFGLLAEVRD